MKILSKHKDYYDYYQGIFGMDKSKVYNRKDVYKLGEYNPITSIPPTEETIYDFFICGKRYRILEYKGKLYHSVEEMEILDKLLIKESSDKYASGIHVDDWKNRVSKNKIKLQYDVTNGIETDVNMKQREPVLINRKKTWHSTDDDYSTPLLSDFNFHKVMDAKTIYIEVETFLGWLVDNPPLPDKQTNVGKITGHGFDKKTSFRPKMKNK